MKNIHLLLLITFLLSSCASAATAIPTSTSTLTLTPSPTTTQTPTPTPTLTPTPTQIGGGSGRLIFSYSAAEFKKYFPDLKGDGHVFIANIDGSHLTPTTNSLAEGFNDLVAVSPDGTKAIISNTKSGLYAINLSATNSEPTKLAEGYSAMWLDDKRIVYVGKGEKGFGIYIINADGTDPVNIGRNNPLEILAVTKDRVYWNTMVDRVEHGNLHFHTYYVWWTNIDGSETGKLEFNGKQIGTSNFWGRDLAFSPDGTKVAWVEGATPTFHHNYLRIASTSDMENPFIVNPEPLTSALALKWRLDNTNLVVFDVGTIREIFGQPEDTTSIVYGLYEITGKKIKNYRLSADILGTSDVPWTTCSDISPDNRLLPCLTISNEKNPDGFQTAKLHFINLETSTVSEAKDFNFLFMNFNGRKISWIP